MSKSYRSCCFLLLFAMICLTTMGTSNAQSEAEAKDLAELMNEKISLKFDGELPTHFVEAIRQQAPDVNIIIHPEAIEVKLPKFQLKDVSIEAAISSLSVVSADRLVVELNETAEYFVVAPNPRRAPASFEVINVVEFLTDHGQISDTRERQLILKNAIDEGTKVHGVHSADMSLKLHEATGLLFVRGSYEETETVKKIVEALSIASMPASQPAN